MIWVSCLRKYFSICALLVYTNYQKVFLLLFVLLWSAAPHLENRYIFDTWPRRFRYTGILLKLSHITASSLSLLSSVFLVLSASLLSRLSSLSSTSESCMLSLLEAKKWPAGSGWSLLCSPAWETLRYHSSAAVWAHYPTLPHPEIRVQNQLLIGHSVSTLNCIVAM